MKALRSVRSVAKTFLKRRISTGAAQRIKVNFPEKCGGAVVKPKKKPEAASSVNMRNRMRMKKMKTTAEL